MRFFAFVLIILATAAAADPVPYRLLADQSRVGFTWYFGEDPVPGTMPVSSADIVLDFDQPANSRVLVAVNAAKSSAGNVLANEAMKGQSVLWTDRFPEIVFRSRRISRDGAGGATVEGDLTLRGVTRRQVLSARLFRPGSAAPGDRQRLTVRLEGSLSRSAFGAAGYAGTVGDRIDLDIQAFVVSEQ
ncbi:MAG: YceI family protein [Silicimonas sp.]|nr:YceI family protein [Silicimonas sp.]